MARKSKDYKKNLYLLRVFQLFILGLFTIYIGFLYQNDCIQLSFTSWESFIESLNNIGVPNNKIITSTNGEVSVYFFDVGQADSILINSQNQYLLIDAGNNEDGPLLSTYLKDNEITHLSYAIGTHSDEDHIGGMDDILKTETVDHFYLPKETSNTSTYKDVIKASKSVEHLSKGDQFNLGDTLFTVLSVDYGASANDSSYVLRMNYGSVCFLFMGDASTDVEKSLLNEDIDCEVLKLGHHGSSTSTSEAFLKAVTPLYGVISVGKNNSYKHPNSSVLELLTKYQVKALRTDELGTIVVKTDGNSITYTTLETQVNG